VLVAFVLQIGVLSDLRPFGVHADLMLLMGVCAGLAGGPSRGAVVGFFAGLLADVMLPGPLGISALAAAVAGFGAGACHGIPGRVEDGADQDCHEGQGFNHRGHSRQWAADQTDAPKGCSPRSYREKNNVPSRLYGSRGQRHGG
jgi:hypothetical protein